MEQFLYGFFTGIILKDPIKSLLKNIFVQSIRIYHKFHSPIMVKPKPKMYIICKITNKDIFNEMFPKLRNNSASRVQPMWKYNDHKETIEIELDLIEEISTNKIGIEFMEEILSDITFTEFLEKLDVHLNIPFFQSFSELFIYIHYTIDTHKYINVYSKEDVIHLSDFELKEPKYKSLVCAIVNTQKPIYITKYFKMFLNNSKNVSVEMLLLHCNEVDKINDCSLKIVTNTSINTLSLYETI